MSDQFETVFGAGRGTQNPAEARRLLGARRRLLAQLVGVVPYSTVKTTATLNARYAAVARSEHNDSLHIVAMSATVEDALEALDEVEDFSPLGIVNLDAANAQACVIGLFWGAGGVELDADGPPHGFDYLTG